MSLNMPIVLFQNRWLFITSRFLHIFPITVFVPVRKAFPEKNLQILNIRRMSLFAPENVYSSILIIAIFRWTPYFWYQDIFFNLYLRLRLTNIPDRDIHSTNPSYKPENHTQIFYPGFMHCYWWRRTRWFSCLFCSISLFFILQNGWSPKKFLINSLSRIGRSKNPDRFSTSRHSSRMIKPNISTVAINRKIEKTWSLTRKNKGYSGVLHFSR